MRNVKARGATLKATEQPIDTNSAKTPSISRRHLPAVVLVSGIFASDRHRAPTIERYLFEHAAELRRGPKPLLLN